MPASIPAFRFFTACAALAGALLATGCSSLLPKPDGAVVGPFYTPANVKGVATFPIGVRRVALLPCAADGPMVSEESLAQLDTILITTFTRAARSELSPLSRPVLARIASRRDIVSTAVLPHDLVQRVTTATGADALLLVDVTAYSPFPPLLIGLRARLIDVKTGEALWNFDNVFSAAEPSVINSARHHVLRPPGPTESSADLSVAVLQNPLRFADYAATAMWATLPPR